MKRKYTLFQVNAFTNKKFSGNPAGVVLDATGLTDNEMLLIAREMNNSETAFMFPSKNKDEYEVEIRFFTPKVEVPICGHATIASHYIRAKYNTDESFKQKYHQKIKVGILPIEISKEDNEIFITMAQGKISFQSIDLSLQKRIIEALGLSEDNLLENYPIEIASTGNGKVMIGIKSKEVLNALHPNLRELTEISKLIHCNGYFVFCVDDQNDQFSTDGRMFAPISGIDEDPVTGNANAPLGAYLIKNKLVKYTDNQFTFIGRQGEAIDRLGSMIVDVTIKDDYPESVVIKGTAVEVFKTEIEI